MIGLALVTHSGLATALKTAAEMIVGNMENVALVEVKPGDKADEIMNRVVIAVQSVSTDGAIILTDLFGGTPSNMAMSFLQEGKIEVVTGVNLTMIVEFFSKRTTMPVGELAKTLQTSAREGIIVAGDFLK